jgi:hypothetical protein
MANDRSKRMLNHIALVRKKSWEKWMGRTHTGKVPSQERRSTKLSSELSMRVNGLKVGSAACCLGGHAARAAKQIAARLAAKEPAGSQVFVTVTKSSLPEFYKSCKHLVSFFPGFLHVFMRVSVAAVFASNDSFVEDALACRFVLTRHNQKGLQMPITITGGRASRLFKSFASLVVDVRNNVRVVRPPFRWNF